MKDFINEHGSIILKFLGIGILLFFLNRIAKIFKGPDGKFQIKEFLQFAAFVIFTVFAAYMIYQEANRQTEYHKFDAVWIFVVFASLLSVLHMDHVIDRIMKGLEMMVRLRAKMPLPEEKKDQAVDQQPATNVPNI